MGVKLALASTDGKFVDQHFGRAEKFQIVEIEDDGYSFIESRELETVGRGYGTDKFDRILEATQDCAGIFVSQIGMRAASYMLRKGKRVFESSGSIEDVIKKVIDVGLFSRAETRKGLT
jgi:predicted Fe-Mo cluster-binding NifX family protein